MSRIDLRHIDLNLFVIFEMIMQERNVPRAAELLSLSQPAVRQALAKLGAIYIDPLFVRVGKDMEPTVRAFELEAMLGPALDSLAAAVSQASQFDPATSNEVIRLGLSDDVELAFPGLMRQLSTEAPDIVIVVRRTHYLSLGQQLSSGEISLGICYIDALPAYTNCQILRRGRSVMVHADLAAGPMTLDDYCARPRALVSMAGNLSGFIDQELVVLGRSRQVTRTIPQFQGLSALLPGTSLIATVPDYAAAALTESGQLRSEALPFPATAFDLSMAWNTSLDLDPAHRWLRGKVLDWFGDDQ